MTVILKRQFITDNLGNPIGVILPLEEYALIEDILKQLQSTEVDEKMKQMAEAATDPLFLEDLDETMTAFDEIDSEWWEPTIQ